MPVRLLGHGGSVGGHKAFRSHVARHVALAQRHSVASAEQLGPKRRRCTRRDAAASPGRSDGGQRAPSRGGAPRRDRASEHHPAGAQRRGVHCRTDAAEASAQRCSPKLRTLPALANKYSASGLGGRLAVLSCHVARLGASTVVLRLRWQLPVSRQYVRRNSGHRCAQLTDESV